jgi:sugar/nucleoside kinase (ribokinase family)
MKIEVVSLGELLVEIMRKELDKPLYAPADFVGPFPSGAPAIFIDAIARLGHSAGFVGAIGNDDFGKCILDRFKRDGVDSKHVKVMNNQTTAVAFVMYNSDGSRKFLYHIPYAAAGHLSPDDVDSDYFRSAKFLHLMGSSLSVNESSREACYKAIRLIKDGGGKVTFDPNLRPELLSIEKIREICQPVLQVCDVVMPSGDESRMLAGIEGSADDACKELLQHGPSIVALKQGEKGSVIYTRNDKIVVPSFKVQEIDPTGAGDCFGAGFIYGLLEGWELEKTARFANAVGAMATTKKGPMEGAPTLEQVLEFMKIS